MFSLPFQLGYHLWLPESYVRSFRIDYLAPTLYLTDIFIFTFIFLNLKLATSIIRRFTTRAPGWLFLLLIGINILVSSVNPVTYLAWLRLSVYLLLLAVLSHTPNLKEKIRSPFLFSLAFILGLAFLQLLRQSSLGGLFYFFGERPLSLALPNVAKINLPWGQFLRPYATFSHPNSLAGFLLVSLVILKQLPGSKILRNLVVLTILLTFSKSAILTLIVLELLKPTIVQSLLLTLTLSFIPFLKLDPSFSSRFYLLSPTIKIILDSPIFGIGLRRFIPQLASRLPASQLAYATLQPVHNLLLLIVSEIGLLPLATILILLLKSKIEFNSKYLPLATIILLTGALDHYWWTLPQNQLIIILAYALLRNNNPHRRRS